MATEDWWVFELVEMMATWREQASAKTWEKARAWALERKLVRMWEGCLGWGWEDELVRVLASMLA